MPPQSRYSALIEKLFFDGFKKGASTIPFKRTDLIIAAQDLNIEVPKNLGDVIYSFRYRNDMPKSILDTQPKNKEWIVEGAGRSLYSFKLVRISRITPNQNLVQTKIPDATPEIVSGHSLSDEQALLAKVRYNRLVDIFLGIASFSLQNHLRTTVKNIGQIEIDEVYVGVDKHGRQFVVPLQAKGGSDQLSVVQTKQDIQCCKEKFPKLICRPLSTQFTTDDLIVMFELTVERDEIKIVDERHYRLVPSDEIDETDLRKYSRRAK